jgi:uncharacterized membrane protein (DUF106 family)
MPWWLTAIVFFFCGMAVNRFIIDRKFIQRTQKNFKELSELNELKRQRIERRLEEGDG